MKRKIRYGLVAVCIVVGMVISITSHDWTLLIWQVACALWVLACADLERERSRPFPKTRSA